MKALLFISGLFAAMWAIGDLSESLKKEFPSEGRITLAALALVDGGTMVLGTLT